MLRFRTYRSLFKHLHVCSDSSSTSSPAPNAEKPILPATSGLEKDPLAKPLEGLPKLQGVIRHMEKEAILPSMDTVSATAPASLPASLSGLHGSLESMPLVSPTSHPFPLLEPSLFGAPSLTRFSGPPHSSVPGPFLSYMPPSPYSLPQASVQHRLRPYLPSQGLPVSNAVWKKSQGETAGPFSTARAFCWGLPMAQRGSLGARLAASAQDPLAQGITGPFPSRKDPALLSSFSAWWVWVAVSLPPPSPCPDSHPN